MNQHVCNNERSPTKGGHDFFFLNRLRRFPLTGFDRVQAFSILLASIFPAEVTEQHKYDKDNTQALTPGTALPSKRRHTTLPVVEGFVKTYFDVFASRTSQGERNQIEPALSLVRTTYNKRYSARGAGGQQNDDCTRYRVPGRGTTTPARPSSKARARRRGSQRRHRLRRFRNARAGLAHSAQLARPVSRLLSTHDPGKDAAGGADPHQLAAQEPARRDGQLGEWQQSTGANDGAAAPDAAAD